MTGKYAVFEARACVFQPGKFTGWGSVGCMVMQLSDRLLPTLFYSAL